MFNGNGIFANDVINSGDNHGSSTVKSIAQITWQNSEQKSIIAEI
jgi:hypothetical protein